MFSELYNVGPGRREDLWNSLPPQKICETVSNCFRTVGREEPLLGDVLPLKRKRTFDVFKGVADWPNISESKFR